MSGPLVSEAGVEKLFAGPCDFVAGAGSVESLPPFGLPEVAFAGRSNVGKSSLINAITGRRSLVRTSRNPGQTKQLNFFNLADKLLLVDMPGYGFARVSRQERAIWDGLISYYLSGRPNLRRVLVLVDARHGLKESDQEVMGLLDQAAVAYRVVLTKADKLNMSEQDAVRAAVEKALKRRPAAIPGVLLTSSETREGIDALRADIVDASGVTLTRG